MIDLEIALSKVELETALALIFSGDAAMRPTQYSDDEDSERSSIVEFESADRIFGPAGGFLWARDCAYEVSISPTGQASIFGSSENASGVYGLLSEFAELDVSFGYGCAHEEREHRNRITRQMDYGVHEAWVGRDFARYLPGLYWLTVIPVDLQQRLGISADRLREIALELRVVDNRNWLVRLYQDPQDWLKEAPRIDAWCADTSGCFSKAVAEEALNQAGNFIEASTLLKEWR